MATGTTGTTGGLDRLMQEIEHRGGVRLTEVGRMFRDGSREAISYAAILEWVKVGVLGPDGRRLKLEAIKVGARWLTSRAAVTRFIAARAGITGGSEGERSAVGELTAA